MRQKAFLFLLSALMPMGMAAQQMSMVAKGQGMQQVFPLSDYPRLTVSTSTNGESSFMVRVNGTVAMTGVQTALFAEYTEPCMVETTDGAVINEDDLPFKWETETFDGSGTRTLTLKSTGGCDSVVTFTLRVRRNNIVLEENASLEYYDDFAQVYNDYTVSTATLNRQFTQGRWATLCLPFNVSKGLMVSLGLNSRVYEFRYAETEGSTIVVHFAAAQSIKAGKGYIVNANAKLAQKTSFVFPNVTIDTSADNADITAIEGYNDGSGRGSIYLAGTLRTGRLTGSADGPVYLGLKNNKLYFPNSTTGTSVRAYRGFFRSNTVTVEIGDGDNEDEPLVPQRVRIMVDGVESGEWMIGNGELGKDNSSAVKFLDNGILYIRSNGSLFNAQGQLIMDN